MDAATIEVIQRNDLLAGYSLTRLWVAAHELAAEQEIPYPTARMRIVRHLRYAAANISEGEEPFQARTKRGGKREGAGRKKIKP